MLRPKITKQPAKFKIGQRIYSEMHEKFVVIIEQYWDTRSWKYKFKDLPLWWSEENLKDVKP